MPLLADSLLEWVSKWLEITKMAQNWFPFTCALFKQKTHKVTMCSCVCKLELKIPLLATAPYQHLHMGAAELLMRTTALHQCQHIRGVRFAYTWNLSQKDVDSRDSMCTNNISESLARSPGPCSFWSSHTGFNPQWWPKHLSQRERISTCKATNGPL